MMPSQSMQLRSQSQNCPIDGYSNEGFQQKKRFMQNFLLSSCWDPQKVVDDILWKYMDFELL